MARVNKSLFQISGKIGDKVYRVINGQSYVCRAPEHFNKPMDAASVLRREKFKFCVKLSSAVKAIPFIDVFWKNEGKRRRELFNKLTTHFYQYADPNTFEEGRLCTSPSFVFDAGQISLNKSGVSIYTFIDSKQTCINTYVEKIISAHGVLMLYDESRPIGERFLFYTINSDSVVLELNKTLNFKLSLSELQGSFYEKFPIRKALFFLITQTAQGEPVSYSVTCCITE